MNPTHDELTACQQTALSEEEERAAPTLVPVPGEQEVAILVARGLTNRQIALELSISECTVENHIGRILEKQGFSSRARIATCVAQR
jgi:DNA-binding NarL/FixJ family response regulator